MSNPHENICRIESAIRDLRADGSDLPRARRVIRDALQDIAQIAPDSSLSLADTFELSQRWRRYREKGPGFPLNSTGQRGGRSARRRPREMPTPHCGAYRERLS